MRDQSHPLIVRTTPRDRPTGVAMVAPNSERTSGHKIGSRGIFLLKSCQPSAIGIIMWPVCRYSVCLSVCNAVHCGSQGRCTGLKVVPSCSRVLNRQVQTLLLYCSMYRLATKCTGKTSQTKRERKFFFDTQTTTRALVYIALLTV